MTDLCHTEYVSAGGGSIETPVHGVLSQSAGGSRYESHAAWSQTQRHWEAGETNRLNRAHWADARDNDINEWLIAQLSTLRARSIYESRQNPTLAGMLGTLADDVVGPDGPQLQVQSDDEKYDEALEQLWRDWFAAPTFRPDLSGVMLLKLWVRNLPRCGEFLATIDTDPNAEGPIQMRLRPRAPRTLESPFRQSGQQHVLGIDFDRHNSPSRYWFRESLMGSYAYEWRPYPPDLVIHGFFLEEEDQARGYPWLTPTLQTAADLRDYDLDVQLAAKRAAQNNGMLYTEHVEAPFWTAPESYTAEPGVVAMTPPGWKPYAFPSTQPAATYNSFREERQREFGRPMGMPLLMVRLDSSKHNYSSARLDTQTYNRFGESIQLWLGGSPTSCGHLNRLVNAVAAEGRFSVPALRRRPKRVEYIWTWTPRPHVDSTKESDAEGTELTNRTRAFSDALAARGRPLDTHMRRLQRDLQAFERYGVPPPPWMTGGGQAAAARDNLRPQEPPEEKAGNAGEKEEATANAK